MLRSHQSGIKGDLVCKKRILDSKKHIMASYTLGGTPDDICKGIWHRVYLLIFCRKWLVWEMAMEFGFQQLLATIVIGVWFHYFSRLLSCEQQGIMSPARSADFCLFEIHKKNSGFRFLVSHLRYGLNRNMPRLWLLSKCSTRKYNFTENLTKIQF